MEKEKSLKIQMMKMIYLCNERRDTDEMHPLLITENFEYSTTDKSMNHNREGKQHVLSIL